MSESLKIVDWNVNGIRASIKKGFFENVAGLEGDILCLQEIKCQDIDMEAVFGANQAADDAWQMSSNTPVSSLSSDSNLPGNDYLAFWHTCRIKKGYSGTAILVKKELLERFDIKDSFTRLGLEELDSEGRIVGIELIAKSNPNQLITLINGYYPQGGREGRVAFKIRFYQQVYNLIRSLIASGREVIITGDLNTTVKDIDLARPKENRRTTGCLPQERVALSWIIEPATFEPSQLMILNPEFTDYQNLLSSLNLIDTFRHFVPDENGHYTYWDQITRARDRNIGWRIDYFLITQGLLPSLQSSIIHNQVLGSDHCPISLGLVIQKLN